MVPTQNDDPPVYQGVKIRSFKAKLIFLLILLVGIIIISILYYPKVIYYEGAQIPICQTTECVVQSFLLDAESNNGVIFQQLVMLEDYKIGGASFDIDLLLDSPITVTMPYASNQYSRIKNDLDNKKIKYEETDQNFIKTIKYEEKRETRIFRAVYLFDFNKEVYIDCLSYDDYAKKHCGYNIASCKYNSFIRANVWPNDLSKYENVIGFFDNFSAQLQSALVKKYSLEQEKCNV